MQMFIGALSVLPVAIVFEGLALEDQNLWLAFSHMSHSSISWLVLSAVDVMLYQTNNTFLCGVASAVTVGVIDSLKTPVVYFGTLLITGKSNESGTVFWIGCAVLLLSGVCYGVANTVNKSSSEEEVEAPSGVQDHMNEVLEAIEGADENYLYEGLACSSPHSSPQDTKRMQLEGSKV